MGSIADPKFDPSLPEGLDLVPVQRSQLIH